ncbi:septum formation family protein [Antribacter gilvus]|uniref:septum formation family protein n=1 Tax=Antribacter gilvus TaxID=2304675 RepID=UPI0013E0379F|nr:septum formation family protein [Antribacter gilvus]
MSGTTAASLAALVGFGALGLGQMFGPQVAEPARDESGAATAAAVVDVFMIDVGDCLDASVLTAEVSSVPLVPCSHPHDSEVYAITELVGDYHPGDAVVAATADTFCSDQFEEFVGLPTAGSVLSYLALQPSEQSWISRDDRLVQCLVTSTEPVTGTMAGIAR